MPRDSRGKNRKIGQFKEKEVVDLNDAEIEEIASKEAQQFYDAPGEEDDEPQDQKDPEEEEGQKEKKEKKDDKKKKKKKKKKKAGQQQQKKQVEEVPEYEIPEQKRKLDMPSDDSEDESQFY